MRAVVQAQPTDTGEARGKERTGLDYCIVLYIQDFYRVQLPWPTPEPVLGERHEWVERVRDGLEGRERLEVAGPQVEGIAEIDLAARGR